MIELKNIYYEIENGKDKKPILKNISCRFENGVTAITGHNGSGKSTLTKIIMGIIKPTSGRVIIDGVDVTNMSVDERANMGVNYAFQQPVVFRGITVKELIDMATGTYNSVSKACEYLSKVGLCAKEYLNREFNKTLSGGEQKRVELALAVAKPGNHLIFDEPEAGIDLWSFEKLTKIFLKDKSYIVVSHQENFLKGADKILILQNGEILAYDNAKKVLKNLPKSCYMMRGENNG